MLCYHLLAVHGLAQKVNGGDVNVQQETSWQQGQAHLMKTEDLLEPRPGVGLKRPQESTFSLEQGLSNTKVDIPNDLPIDTTGANTIMTNSENCQPLSAGGRLRARGGKEGQAPPVGPNLKCPLPVITGTDTPQSGQQQHPSTTGHGGDEREEGQAPGETNQDQPLVLPNLIRIPMNDGDNPTCYDATYGLMPVGVCQNTQQIPQPSKYDVFMSRNIDIYARAWKLIDSRPGASSLSSPQFYPTEEFYLYPEPHGSNLTYVLFLKPGPACANAYPDTKTTAYGAVNSIHIYFFGGISVGL